MADMQKVISLLEDMSTRLGRVEAKVGTGSSSSSAAAAAPAAGGSSNPILAAYDEWLATSMAPIDEAALGLKENKFRSAKKCANFIRKAAMGVRVVLEAGTKCKEPTPAEFGELMKTHVWAVQKLGKDVRTKKLGRNYEKQLGEIMDVFNWPTQAGEMGPVEFLNSEIGSVEYHSNRCRVEYKPTKHKDLHMAYCAGVKALIENLKKFVLCNGMKKKFKWNSNGVDLSYYAPSDAPAKAAPAKAATKEAAPAKAAPAKAKKKKEVAPEMDMQAMFAELSKGCAVTKNMKHVSDNMKVYKNAKLRKSGPVTMKKKAPKKAGKAKKKKGPAKCEYTRMQRMWYVENQVDDSVSEVTFEKKNQGGYVYRCDKGTVTFKGKGKNIQIVNCDGTKLIFDDVLAGIEVTNSKNIKIVCLGRCQMFRFDASDGVNVYLDKADNLADVTFSTTKCSEMNVEFPDPDAKEAGDTIQKPIPSVYEHSIKGAKIVSEVSHLYG